MKNNILFSITCVLLICLGSCVKDKSIGIVNQLNEITIERIAGYDVKSGDILTITPVFSSSMNDLSNLSYLWYSYPSTSATSFDILSTDKDLNVPVKLSIGKHFITLKVTDKTTGIFYLSNTIQIEVFADSYTKGLVLLTENAGKAELNFFDTLSKQLYRNVYSVKSDSLVSSTDLGTRPVSVVFHPVVSKLPAEILVLCNDQQGGAVVDPSTMTKIRSIRDAFILPFESTGDLNAQKYCPKMAGNIADYLVVNGKLHNRSINAATASDAIVFKPALYGDDKDYIAAPETFSIPDMTSRLAIYDTKNRRFLCHSGATGVLTAFNQNENIAGAYSYINPNNVSLDLLYAGVVRYVGNAVPIYYIGAFFGLFKNPTGSERYILTMNMSPQYVQSFTSTDKYLLTNATDIDKASSYASSIGLSNYFFYAVGSKVYFYNIISKTPSVQLLDLGAGKEINFIKFPSVDGTELRIGYTDNNLTGKKGCYIPYSITTSGGVTASPVNGHKIEGLGDKVIDVTSKY